MKNTKFHGRFESQGRQCEHPDCDRPGEFRAPGSGGHGFDGPGQWRWFCLEHVREFNAGYDWFEGMSAEEILDAQSPASGWRTQNRVYSGMGGDMPRWADYDDPLDAINNRARDIKRRAAGAQAEYNRFTPHEREALNVMGLGADADRQGLRRRYSELVRRYHPDRNGGDRQHETRLQRVVEAYQLLRRATAFA
ncbi:J domain-containing protein [Altericroceibacterium spongiae]|uniref:J domain-containing protein n=1 Tax=Altericroceibacterium spongiae TaxID=2320269 RepID=A0A420ES67_9SPHN|nr:J domain-containing protein [Altericroceibacterium spongiae]RKF23564.1 J domain-containing protein [Altericroceibacterium spongiae]